MKKTLCVLMCLCLTTIGLLPCVPVSAADARLYDVYQNGMLFRQNNEAVFRGEAPAGSTVKAALYNAAGRVISEGQAKAEGGTFEVGFPTPEGGWTGYTVRLSCNGSEFAVLTDVVFGELWLAIGQSNMEYTLRYTDEGKAMIEAGKTGSGRVRVLYVPHKWIDGSLATEYLPQTDAPGCVWFTSDSELVYEMSAVAYFFAEELSKTLGMPVGVLNAPLGGSGLASWLSREAIDGNAAVKKHLTDDGTYYTEERWSSPDRAAHIDMTNMYNLKIAPLTAFRPTGAIWYQGCTDLMLNHSNEYYYDLFELMQKSYTKDFGCKNGALPFIFCQIALYDYGKGPFAVTAFNQVFTDLAQNAPQSRGMTPIYDLSLDYNEMGAIHPKTKKPIGERMESIAEALVYGKKQPASAPSLKNAEARDGSVYLTFENAGNGLVFSSDAPRGFSICGADGVAVAANAEIVSRDTVRVFSPDVKEPVAAAYAAGAWGERANLWSTVQDALYLPAAPCGIDDPAIKHHYADNAWTDCEDLTFFESGPHDGYTDAWKTSGCEISVDTTDRAQGLGSLRIESTRSLFTLSPVIGEKKDLKTKVFDDVDPDWSDYAVLRLRLKNDAGADVRLNAVRLYVSDAAYYAPVCAATDAVGVTLPADNAWHEYVFDLTRLQLFGTAGVEGTAENKLENVQSVVFSFEGRNAILHMDEIRLLSAAAAAETPAAGRTLSFFAKLAAALRNLFERIRVLFGIKN